MPSRKDNDDDLKEETSEKADLGDASSASEEDDPNDDAEDVTANGTDDRDDDRDDDGEDEQKDEQEEKGGGNNEQEEEEVEDDDVDDGSDDEGDDDDDDDDEGADDTTEGAAASATTEPRKVHRLSMAKTEDFNAKLKRRGVLYVARVPPRMTPTKMKRILSDFGEVTRIFLVEEDASVRRRRRKSTGNGSKHYVEGWVEFASKRIAKQVALTLNNTQISNYKRSPHFGDLWNVKYLHKFKWSHLTEKVAYERRVREQKLRLETLQARKETAAYKQLVEEGKKRDKMEERRRKRAEREGKPLPERNTERKRPRQLKPMDGGANEAASKPLLRSLV